MKRLITVLFLLSTSACDAPSTESASHLGGTIERSGAAPAAAEQGRATQGESQRAMENRPEIVGAPPRVEDREPRPNRPSPAADPQAEAAEPVGPDEDTDGSETRSSELDRAASESREARAALVARAALLGADEISASNAAEHCATNPRLVDVAAQLLCSDAEFLEVAGRFRAANRETRAAMLLGARPH